MATKIRLQRHGRKGYAFYHVVVADSRAPRDGKFIERLGSYNPNTNPATIDLNFERALYWVQTGAQPTDTARNILSDEGVMMKKHLIEGVKKGAFDLEKAEEKFAAWKQAKENQIIATKGSLSDAKKADAKKRLEAEVEVNKAKAAILAEKLAVAKASEAEAIAAAAPAPVEEAVVAPEVVAEVAPEAAVVAPEVVAEVAPEAVAEVAPEAVAEEKAPAAE